MADVVEPLYLKGDRTRNGSQLAASLSATIEDEIIRRGWPVGEVIGTEADLVARFGVSSPVLRQAAGILESHQVAKMRRGPGGGLVVTAPDERAIGTAVGLYLEYLRVDPRLVSEARAAVELACVELAAQRVGPDDVPRLREIVGAEPERARTGDFECLQDVHLAIADLSGNPVLGLFLKMLMSLLSGRANAGGRRPGDHTAELERAHADHVAVVDALAGGDASLARLHMLRHLEVARYDSAWWKPRD